MDCYTEGLSPSCTWPPLNPFNWHVQCPSRYSTNSEGEGTLLVTCVTTVTAFTPITIPSAGDRHQLEFLNLAFPTSCAVSHLAFPSCFPLIYKTEIIFLLQERWRRNANGSKRHLAQYLPHSRCSINVGFFPFWNIDISWWASEMRITFGQLCYSYSPNCGKIIDLKISL